jgi:glycerol uptake facilitator-like aquaporin
MLGSREQRPAYTGLLGAGCLIAVSLATPSMSFANPAVTLARTLTDSFTSIRLEDSLMIVAIQLFGAVAAWSLVRWLSPWDKGDKGESN